MKRTSLLLALALSTVALAAACSSPTETPDAAVTPDAPVDAPPAIDAGPPIEPLADYGAPGPHPVASVRTSIVDRTGMRTLPLEIWYPADESARAEASTGRPMEAFEAGTENEAAITELAAAAPAACVRRTMHAASGAMPSAAPAMLPAVIFSHCHVCTRYDVAEISERLASHGIVVAAPDHVGNTLWDERAGMAASVGAEFLAVRASDVSSVLDRLLDATATELPEGLRGRIDATRVAVMGHSFGAVTTGLVATTDDRFAAAMAIAAPLTALGGVSLDDVHVPYLFVLAREDNSIGEIGNRLIRNDFTRLDTPAWLVEVDDAGHWSFSDICGLVDFFGAGCGEGTRQTAAGGAFTYLDPATAREIGADAAMGFFAMHLLGDPGGATFLARMSGPAHVTSHP